MYIKAVAEALASSSHAGWQACTTELQNVMMIVSCMMSYKLAKNSNAYYVVQHTKFQFNN